MHFCSLALACWLLAPINTISKSQLVIEQPKSEQPESVSCGSTNRGSLSDSSRMPTQGPGFVMAQPWRSRGTRYGSKEMVSLIERVAAHVNQLHPGSQLSVADMSKEHGGAIASHRSHQSGRDVDLIFYAMDAKGEPFYPDSHMAYYEETGEATSARAPKRVDHIPKRFFDLKRNWSLARALIVDKEAIVQHIFVSRRVKHWLIDYAAQIGESKEMLQWANKILHLPRGARGHNDHMHVRILCSDEDHASGQCTDRSARKPRSGRKWHRVVPCPLPADALYLP